MTILPLEYYSNDDLLFLCRDLLGKFLLTQWEGEELTGGMVIETEAYRGPEDRASHAYGNRRTKRNEVMFHQGGVGYIYLCYGIHALFNIITNQKEIPHGILIRAIAPMIGIETMLKRRKKSKVDKNLTGGPGTVTEALGIRVMHNGLLLDRPPIWVEDRGIEVDPAEIIVSPRIGVGYAGEDALLPWRFRCNRGKIK